jgi:hypothetical protein
MNIKFPLGSLVRCNGNDQARVVAIDSWDGIIFYTIRLWDGSRLVGDTQMSESSLEMQQTYNRNVMR